MNKTISLAIFILYSIGVFAQFAIVNDKNGYVIVRSSPKIERNNVIDTLYNGDFVYAFFGTKHHTGWIEIGFKYDNYGYISANGIKDIFDYQNIRYLSTEDDKQIFSNDTILIEIKRKEFDPSKHRIEYKKKTVRLIDGEHFYGTTGKLPKHEYEYISITQNGSTYFLPNEAIKNLYDPDSNYSSPNWGNVLVALSFYDKENDILYIQSMIGNDVAAYAVIWKVEKGFYKERAIFPPLCYKC